MSNGDERAARMNQMSMRRSFHVDAFASFACSPGEKKSSILLLLLLTFCCLCSPVGYATRWREWGSDIA